MKKLCGFFYDSGVDVGSSVGTIVGSVVGIAVGAIVGTVVGAVVGVDEGSVVLTEAVVAVGVGVLVEASSETTICT